MAAYFRPKTLDEAVATTATGALTILAGGTDLYPASKNRDLAGPVVDLSGVSGLSGITKDATGYRIGAMTSWSDVIAHNLPHAFDGLKEAAREVGSVQIQNAGTVGGNICNSSPAADGIPPLLALDARVELASIAGTRDLSLTDFLVGVRRTALRPGEILAALTIPTHACTGVSGFRKLGARRFLVISIAMVSARLEIENGRVVQAAIAIGACSERAVRLADVEAALLGHAANDQIGTFVAAPTLLQAIEPITDIRADAGYRNQAAVIMVRRLLADLCAEHGGTE